MQFTTILLSAAALVAPVLAQTWTSCNPMNATCPNDPGFGITHNFVFNESSTVTDTWNITAGSLVYGSNGTEFIINEKGDSPTIESQFYIFWGSVSVVMKAASGQGIISSIVLESDDLDEVDWEFLGGNGTYAETNYFGKGNTTLYNRAIYYPTDSDYRDNFHNYTTHWTSSQLEWYIDSVLVRTLEYGDADGGYNYPQTPMTVRMGIWAGGDPDNSNGTIEWAGGLTDYSDGPFTMTVQSALISDYSTGSAYEWTDKTGSFTSIKAIPGNSTAAETLEKVDTPSLSIAQKFAALPQATKVAVYAGGGAVAAILFSAFALFCFRQRRAGKKEREAYNSAVEKEREDAFKSNTNLQDQGLGGFDMGAEKQGENALGGWQRSRQASQGYSVPQGYSSEEYGSEPHLPQVMTADIPLRVNSPPIARHGSPAPSYSTYGGRESTNFSGSPTQTNFSRNPSFPLGGAIPLRKPSNGGYQRF